jgi:hypothetical protein
MGEPEQAPGGTVAPQKTADEKSPPAEGQSLVVPHVPPTPPNPPPTHHGRQDNTPPWKKKVEIGALGVAILLLIVNIFQMCGTQKAADAAKSAAETADAGLKITRALTEGANEAICYGTVDCMHSEDGKCVFSFSNVGHVAAKRVHARIEFSIRLISPSNTQIGKTDTTNIYQEEIAPRTPVGNPLYAPGHGDINRTTDVPMLRVNRSEIEGGNRAIMINITLLYDNGFGTQKTSPYCEEIAYGRTGPPPSASRIPMLVACDDGPAGIVTFIRDQLKLDRAVNTHRE